MDAQGQQGGGSGAGGGNVQRGGVVGQLACRHGAAGGRGRAVLDVLTEHHEAERHLIGPGAGQHGVHALVVGAGVGAGLDAPVTEGAGVEHLGRAVGAADAGQRHAFAQRAVVLQIGQIRPVFGRDVGGDLVDAVAGVGQVLDVGAGLAGDEVFHRAAQGVGQQGVAGQRAGAALGGDVGLRRFGGGVDVGVDQRCGGVWRGAAEQGVEQALQRGRGLAMVGFP